MHDFEVTFDELTEHIENGMVMGFRHEILPDGEWIRAVRRATRRDDLYVYRHRVHGKFILCQMLHWEPRVCVELESMALPPDRGGWLPLEYLRMRCGSQHQYLMRMRDRMRQAKKLRLEQRRESESQQRELARHLRRRGKDEIAAGVELAPWVGDREGGESLAMVREELSSMMRVC